MATEWWQAILRALWFFLPAQGLPARAKPRGHRPLEPRDKRDLALRGPADMPDLHGAPA